MKVDVPIVEWRIRFFVRESVTDIGPMLVVIYNVFSLSFGIKFLF